MNRLYLSAVSVAMIVGCSKPPTMSEPSPEQQSTVRNERVLSDETKEEIAVLVRTGFYDKPSITEIICEEMYEPGEQDPSAVMATIDAENSKLSEEKKTWPKVTDCDRVEHAFMALEKRGVIALHNAGYTQSDGHDDFREAYAKHPQKDSIVGYCFYHGQDVERAINGGGLFIAFGPLEPKEEEAKGPAIGKLVREELERVGLAVEWDGTFATRMSIPKFTWQRR